MLRQIALFALSASAFAQYPFKQIVVFGDSLSDNGNFYFGTSLLGIPTPAPPKYATGEYTDGVDSVPSTTSPLGLWIEQLAPQLKLPVPQPFAKGGLNYATASAQTGKDPLFVPGLPTVPWSTDQVNEFLKSNPTAPADYLYMFWCGGNDLIAGVSPNTAVSNIQANIDTLASAGAKYFYWANMPPLGEVPENINTPQRAALDAASAAYRPLWTAAIQQLESAHPGIQIIPYDAYATATELVASASAYGFANVTSPAQGLSGVNPNTYLYWDGLHPTTAGHAQIATGAFNAIQAQFLGIPAISEFVNAFGENPVIALNTWVALKGLQLTTGGDTRTWTGSDFVNGQMPTKLDGVSVTVNNQPAYMYYISPTQLNILTPPSLPNGTVDVQVTVGQQTSTVLKAQSQAISPSFFAFDGTHVVAQHLYGGSSCPGYVLCDVGPASLYPGLSLPAKPNEEVILYANGFGSTSVPVVAGSSTQSGSLPSLPVITIGGTNAQVLFAGLAGPGLYQFNVVVPPTASNGDLPLTATFGGQTTQAGVVITVQN